jgi:hypothetical protein
VKVNKLSLKQDGGPSHQMPDGTTMPGATHGESTGQPQQQVDPAIQKITEFISTSISNGDDPIDVVMTLVDQQVDQQTIAEVFMQVGYAQEDVVALFEQVQQKMQPPGPASPEQQTQDPQEIARNEAMAEESQMQQAKSGIEIKPKNEGKFTAWAKARSMSVQEAASKVMSNKDEYPPSVVKMANFAKNAAGWNKKQEGGEKTPEMIEYLKALEFNKKARQAVGTNDKELLASFTSRIKSNTPYGERELARDFSELQKLRQAAGLGLMEEASILLPHVGQQLRGSFNQILGTNLKEGGEFEPHFMYKGERKIRAKDMETHLRLKEAGYGHDAPKAQRGLEIDELGNKLIDGVVQAKDEYTKGAPNYINPLAFESGNNFSVSDGLQVLGNGITGLFGRGDENEDGLQDGFFRNVEEKKKLRELNKGNYYNYEIEKDLNDPNAYGFDTLDLYNASIGQGGLRDLQTFTNDVNENSRVNFNSKTGKYNSLMSSRSLDEDVFGNRNAFSGENLNYFNDVDADTRQQIIDYGNASANGMPEGTTLSIDPETGAVSYVDAGVNNPNQYDTMMGYNAYGKGNAKQQAKAMISDGTPAMTNEPSIMEVDNKLSFKEWTMQNPVARMSANAQMEYQDYLNEESSLKYGGSLPEAQMGMFDFTSTFNQDQLQDQEQYFSNMFSGQTNYMQDTADVADTQLQNRQPLLGPTPLQQSNQAMFQPQQNLDLSSFVEEEEPEVDLPEFNDPTVTKTNKLQGDVGRFMDSRGMQAYTGASKYAIEGARVINNFFDDRAIEDAKADNRNNMVADNLYATNENPMLKRGAWDVNTGTFGSEGQRTVRTNYGMAQEGGEMATVDSLLLAKLIAAGADIEIL